jgi:hypothetical protein
MVEAIKKKTTPPERRKEAYWKPNGKKLEGTPTEKGKKNLKMEQCGTPPYVNIIKELATPIPVVNKEVYLDRDTTSYLKGCTEGKNAGKQIYHVPLDARHILGCVTPVHRLILFLIVFMLKFMMRLLLAPLSLLTLLSSLQIKPKGNPVASLKMST